MPSARSSRSSSAAFARPDRAPVGTITALAAGAFGLAWPLTTTAAYLPPPIESCPDSTTLVGLEAAVDEAASA